MDSRLVFLRPLGLRLIKPCMCKFKPLYGETANGSIGSVIVYTIIWFYNWITVVILELIHEKKGGLLGTLVFIRNQKTN